MLLFLDHFWPLFTTFDHFLVTFWTLYDTSDYVWTTTSSRLFLYTYNQFWQFLTTFRPLILWPNLYIVWYFFASLWYFFIPLITFLPIFDQVLIFVKRTIWQWFCFWLYLFDYFYAIFCYTYQKIKNVCYTVFGYTWRFSEGMVIHFTYYIWIFIKIFLILRFVIPHFSYNQKTNRVDSKGIVQGFNSWGRKYRKRNQISEEGRSS